MLSCKDNYDIVVTKVAIHCIYWALLGIGYFSFNFHHHLCQGLFTAGERIPLLGDQVLDIHQLFCRRELAARAVFLSFTPHIQLSPEPDQCYSQIPPNAFACPHLLLRAGADASWAAVVILSSLLPLD